MTTTIERQIREVLSDQPDDSAEKLHGKLDMLRVRLCLTEFPQDNSQSVDDGIEHGTRLISKSVEKNPMFLDWVPMI